MYGQDTVVELPAASYPVRLFDFTPAVARSANVTTAVTGDEAGPDSPSVTVAVTEPGDVLPITNVGVAAQVTFGAVRSTFTTWLALP